MAARRMCEAFDDAAAACVADPTIAGGLTVSLHAALIAPFTEFEFMRRALAARDRARRSAARRSACS